MGEKKPMYEPPQVIPLDRLASAAGTDYCKFGPSATSACGTGGSPLDCSIGSSYKAGQS
jgi:hypothetical protein